MHNYAYHDVNHPNTIKGVALEDLSTMEYIFSMFNNLASVICYITVHNHQLFINLFFCQWDEDQYLSLGKMLLDNYKQALCIIKDDGFKLAQAKQSLGITDETLNVWFKE
ncbi:hypothetical protein J3R82DRAFT_1775 [Butyriboletus roseoflavus]|nr:hypothetical protein J3R82DRAFT_1775 [Butyriboletus roseoflavus]